MNTHRWTPAEGVKRALVRLTWRSAVALAAWAALVLVIVPLMDWWLNVWAVYLGLALLLIPPGLALGRWISEDLAEEAGMSSLLLPLLATVFTWAVILAGATIADLAYGITTWQHSVLTFATGFWATIAVYRELLIEV